MIEAKEFEERLRESACNGDIDTLKALVETEHVDVNSKNSMNGWTALHWGAKRNHVPVVTYLLSHAADKSILSSEGQKAASLSSNPEIKALLGYEGGQNSKSALPITANYLSNPVFPYTQGPTQRPTQGPAQGQTTVPQQYPLQSANVPQLNPDELVLKARVAYRDDKDFIEVELEKNQLTFEGLTNLLVRELGVEKRLIQKIRKLPNTILRKDKDVQRLVDFQELEVVVGSHKSGSMSSRSDISDGIKQEQILY